MQVATIQEACEKTGYSLDQIEAAAAMMPPALQNFVRGFTLRAVVVEAMNNGEVPDQSDYGQEKFEAIFDLDVNDDPAGFKVYETRSWFSTSLTGARLQLLSKEDALFFATNPNFKQIHRDALTYKPVLINH